MAKGKIKWFNFRRGYGFITDENGKDIFVHHKGIKYGRRYTGYEQGDEVEFETGTDDKGKEMAINVSFAAKDDDQEK